MPSYGYGGLSDAIQKNNPPKEGYLLINISIAIPNRACQIKEVQPLEKSWFLTAGTTDGQLYKQGAVHIGRYSTIPLKYVNIHLQM